MNNSQTLLSLSILAIIAWTISSVVSADWENAVLGIVIAELEDILNDIGIVQPVNATDKSTSVSITQIRLWIGLYKFFIYVNKSFYNNLGLLLC